MWCLTLVVIRYHIFLSGTLLTCKFYRTSRRSSTFLVVQTSTHSGILAPADAWGGCTPVGSKSLISRVKTPVFRCRLC